MGHFWIDDTSVESDSSSVDDTAGAILVPDFKNNPDQDDIFATPCMGEGTLP